MNIYPKNFTEHFDYCDNEVCTFGTATDDDIVFEVKWNKDAEHDWEDDVEGESEILRSFGSENGSKYPFFFIYGRCRQKNWFFTNCSSENWWTLFKIDLLP